MKLLLATLLLALSTPFSFAEAQSFDSSTINGNEHTLDFAQLKSQLQIEGSLYVLNPAGDVLYYQSRESRTWKFGKTGNILSYWTFLDDDVEPMYIRHEWSIGTDKRITAHIQQYDNIVGNPNAKPELGKLLKERTYVLDNFSPITWQVQTNQRHKVVARFSPSLSEIPSAKDFATLPIVADQLFLSDSQGRVWINNESFRGRFVSINVAEGSAYLSFQPFKGATELGHAKDNRMTLMTDDGNALSLVNSSPFLPMGIEAKVYGQVKLKTAKGQRNSINILTSDEKSDFVKALGAGLD